MGYLLGLDIGSSSVKAALIDDTTGKLVASATQPKSELEIIAKKAGWAEQHPDIWWKNVVAAVAEIKQKAKVNLHDVEAIGISYQMHGLVTIDKNGTPLRPSIIWCDSRAVPFGQKAFADIGPATCLKNLLNSPGNFTAAKLAWVKKNEPALYKKIDKFMLPGDYIALKLTGECTTTESGLSEGILWNFQKNSVATMVLDYFGISDKLLPEVVPTFAVQGLLTSKAAQELGLTPGTPISYRAGDQPNNALSLNVLNPGEIAATAGTSGVVYGVGKKPNFDKLSRVNTFLHVNHTEKTPRYGTLLCVGGTGILNSWLKHSIATVGSSSLDYKEMDVLAQKIPVGSDGLSILPYGNGAERTLVDRDLGATIHGLKFNTHTRAHMFRAAQEGIVFALNYGLEIMKDMEITISTVRAGHANMFLSPIFSEAFATVSGARVELYSTDGAQGAARGAGIGAQIFSNFKEAFTGLKALKAIEPNKKNAALYKQAYSQWKDILVHSLKRS